jgi:hypothetical protein
MSTSDAEPALPERSSDEHDVGWGDEQPFADDDVQRLVDDLPPHHVERD